MLLTAPDRGSVLKMADFGLSKHLSDITSASMRSTISSAAASAVGTPHYMAPEILDVVPAYSPASDVFAFGVVCWETISMKLPYAECVDMHLLKKSIRKKGLRPPFPGDFPPALRPLIEHAWHSDPAQRPCMQLIVRELERFLQQLHTGAQSSFVSDSRCSAPPAPDSRVPASTIAAPPPDSSVVGVEQLASLTDVQVGFLVDTAGSHFKAKGYGQAAVNKKVEGNFILKANEVELSLLFSQMGVDAVDMPALRKAVSSWKADPAQVFSCLAQAKVRAVTLAAFSSILRLTLRFPNSHSSGRRCCFHRRQTRYLHSGADRRRFSGRPSRHG
jgi:serine/threonine protein kinase